MSKKTNINHATQIPDVLKGMVSIHKIMDEYNFEIPLTHLVYLRASQINRCSHCVDMHTREARRDGETNERLDNLVVWEQASEFSEKEKAAFAWTEALTVLDGRCDLSLLRDNLRRYFSEKEISVLTANIAMINLWNRIQISAR